ncbi:MAG: sel1 repeat family protein [Proteobacteria bacterium]|nr:sel1 repeat family protein [Pseudomonadota bacterium]MCH8301155.1 sel1 repeat family protein [Pseudomonadota bacterium]
MKIRTALIVGLLAAFFCVPVQSQMYKPFPGESADQRTLQIQKRVDELYDAGDYKRALFIYEKDLAPRGDKYAQYMVGFMYVTDAHNVPQDTARALAWYRLAAERGNDVLEGARDELAATLTRDEIDASNQIFLDLLQKIGDTRLLMKLIQRDMNTLRSRTGTHIPGSRISGPMQIVRPSGMPENPNYYRDIRLRLEARLNYLETKVEISDITLESDYDGLRMFQEQVKSELAALGIP